MRTLHRRRHEVRRGQLARDVDDEEQRAPAVLDGLRDADEVKPVDRAAVLDERLRLEVAQHVEQRDEDRDLEDDRQARGGRVDLVLAVELHQLLVLPLLVVLPLLLERLHLGRVRLQVLHRVDLLDGDRHEEDAHEHGEDDDRPRPGEPDRLVQPDQDPLEEVLERAQRVGEREDLERSRGCSVSWRRRPKRASSARSTPPWLHGLQRRIRQPAKTAALEEAVDPEGVDRVLRAARVVLARAGRASGGRTYAARPGRGAIPMIPHAAAFPSTSVTCSTSHWWPRVSAGSATPERAART